MRCEDYPGCGHGDGDCPKSGGTFKCVQCGKKLSKKAVSSICPKCARRLSTSHYSEDIDHDYSMNN